MPALDVLVTGAAGKTGQAVLRALARQGQRSLALVRRPEQAAAALQAGAAEALSGDLLDGALLRAAMQRVRAAYLIVPNVHPQETEIGHTAILAAQAAGLAHLVYHSVLLPAVQAMPHHWQKHLVEQALLVSGLRYTSLQPASYMQNVLPYWAAIAAGHYVVPYSTQAVFSPVDLDDVAETAARVLGDSAAFDGRVLPLAGPELLSSAQMAAALSEHLGRPVQAEAQPLAAWRQAAQANGLSGYALEALERMFAYYDAHGFSGDSGVLRMTLGRTPTRFGEFLSRLGN